MRAPATAVTEAVDKLTKSLRERLGGYGEMTRAGPADRAIGIEQPGQQCATLRLRGTQKPRGDVLIPEHSEAAEDACDRPIRRSTSLAHPRSGRAARERPATPGTGGPLPPVGRSGRLWGPHATARHDLRRCPGGMP